MSQKKQFAVVNKTGEIEAIVLIRDAEFYCYERLEQPPKNMKDLMGIYTDCNVVEIQMKAPTPSTPHAKAAHG
jgi:hypothetical protein